MLTYQIEKTVTGLDKEYNIHTSRVKKFMAENAMYSSRQERFIE